MVLLYQVRRNYLLYMALLTNTSLPIGAVTIGVICLILKHPKQEDMSNLGWKERIQRLDFPGNALFMALVVSAF